METEATYNGLTYDQAANRHADLDDAREYLTKAANALADADFDTEALMDILSDVTTERTNMAFVMAACKQIEEKAAFRLGGDL